MPLRQSGGDLRTRRASAGPRGAKLHLLVLPPSWGTMRVRSDRRGSHPGARSRAADPLWLRLENGGFSALRPVRHLPRCGYVGGRRGVRNDQRQHLRAAPSVRAQGDPDGLRGGVRSRAPSPTLGWLDAGRGIRDGPARALMAPCRRRHDRSTVGFDRDHRLGRASPRQSIRPPEPDVADQHRPKAGQIRTPCPPCAWIDDPH
jgi:hypothetical protein